MKNYKTEKKINESLSVWGITLDEIKTAIENFSTEIDDLDTRIEEEFFQQSEIINHQAEQISECA